MALFFDISKHFNLKPLGAWRRLVFFPVFLISIGISFFERFARLLPLYLGLSVPYISSIFCDFDDKDLYGNFSSAKPYFMGDEPTELDCAMFGLLAHLVWNLSGSPFVWPLESRASSYDFAMII